jgi:hypothetical protein
MGWAGYIKNANEEKQMAIQSLKKVEIEEVSGGAGFDLSGLLGGVPLLGGLLGGATGSTGGTVNGLVSTLSAIPLVGPILGTVLGLFGGLVSI